MTDTIARPRIVQPGDPPPRMPPSKAAALCVDSAELFAYSALVARYCWRRYAAHSSRCH
jgi:hypothetical protein